VLAGAGAVGVSYLQTPVYEGTATIVFKAPSETGGTPTSDTVPPGDRYIRTQVKVIQSEPVRAKVRTALGLDVGVTVAAVPGADAVEVRGRSSDPEGSADIANAYVNAFLEYRRELSVDEVLASRDRVRAQVTALEQQVNTVPAPQNAVIASQLTALRAQLAQLEQQAAQMSEPEVIEPADLPSSPISPQPLRTGAIALAGGLLLGILVAGVGELLDDSVKSKADFQRTVPGVRVLGLIPAVAQWRSKDEAYTVSLADPQSPASEAFRTLRTGLLHLRDRVPFRSLQVTSASASEGKTTTAVNLAVAFAAAGQRVVLVGCDLRRPRVHEFFDLSNDIGFTSVLLGKVPLSRALQEVTPQPRLYVLGSGPLPPNPSELLASRRTNEVLRSLAADADLVIIDSPPLLPVADALVLSEAMDATLLVSVVCSSARSEVRRAVELLRGVDAPLLGAVLNGVSPQESYGEAYVPYRNSMPSAGRSR